VTEQFDIEAITAQFCRIPALLRQLDVTITRQDKTGARGVGSSGHTVTPLAFGLRASNARVGLRTAVRATGMGWMLRSYSLVTPGTIYSRVSQLVTGGEWTVEHSEAIDGAIAEAVEAIDLPPAKVEGPSVRELSSAANQLAYPDDMAKLITTYFEEKVAAATIRSWAKRGKIEGVEVEGRVAYRVGDVLALLRRNKPQLAA
jgi:hypothetical protein